MADKLIVDPDDGSVVRKFKDMGDGTFAEVLIVSSSFPAGATPVLASAKGANAAIGATLPAAPGKTTYVTGFEITGGGATVGGVVEATLAGLLGGTASYVVGAVAGVLAANPPILVRFVPPLPASAPNTALVLSVPALGLGNSLSAAVIHGYQQG